MQSVSLVSLSLSLSLSLSIYLMIPVCVHDSFVLVRSVFSNGSNRRRCIIFFSHQRLGLCCLINPQSKSIFGVCGRSRSTPFLTFFSHRIFSPAAVTVIRNKYSPAVSEKTRDDPYNLEILYSGHKKLPVLNVHFVFNVYTSY